MVIRRKIKDETEGKVVMRTGPKSRKVKKTKDLRKTCAGSEAEGFLASLR